MTYIITFGIMTLTAIFTSALTTKAKQAAEEARERENESNALYQMTNHLTDAEGVEAIAEITVRSVSEVLGCSAARRHQALPRVSDASSLRSADQEKDLPQQQDRAA